MTVKGVEETAEQVEEDGGPRAAGHQEERQQGQDHPGVTCRIRGQRYTWTVTGTRDFLL